MRYRIYDLQCHRYFWDGHVFKNRKEMREGLIDYHKIDVNNKWLNSMNLDTICAEFDWLIEKQGGKR